MTVQMNRVVGHRQVADTNANAIVVANDYAGYEFPVVVTAGETTDICQLQFLTTATPDE